MQIDISIEDFFLEKLKIISKIIENKFPLENNVGVLEGLTGICLFNYYYDEFIGGPNELGGEILKKSIDLINEGFLQPTFSQGVSGFGWTLDHLQKEKFIDINTDELLGPIDTHVQKALFYYINKNNLDFLHGALGCAYYFLNRYNSTSSISLKKSYQNILMEFLNELNKNFVFESVQGLVWVDKKNNKRKVEFTNLSLSHGVSSIVNILTRLNKNKVFQPFTENLLKNLTTYLLKFKDSDKNAFSLFPNNANSNKVKTRIAWCYGDLGIGLTLLKAAMSLNDEKIQLEVTDILEHSARRLTPEKSLVVDPYLCHGAFGNFQMYHRIWEESSNPIFLKARDSWVQMGVNMLMFRNDFIENTQRNSHLSTLNGISGIGLAMINYLREDIPKWDECLLIS